MARVGAAFTCAVELHREDGSSAAQVPVPVDWTPAVEYASLEAIRSGVDPNRAFSADWVVEPMFDPTRGAPYLRSVEVRINGNGGSALRIGTDYFAAAAGRASSQLVGEEVLREGETIRYTVLAYPLPDQDAPPAGSIDVTLAAPALTLSASAFPEGRRRGALGDAGDLPVVLPVSLLDETAALAIADRPRETGGILIGHLARDPGDGKLFARVTAQVPAQHAEATSTRLTFAPATWTSCASTRASTGRPCTRSAPGSRPRCGAWPAARSTGRR